MDKFPCTMCGACCKKVGQSLSLIDNNKDSPLCFPYSWDETGKCENLNDDNTCKVYDKRPIICNIEEMRKRAGRTKKDYYDLNIKACNYLMDMSGVDIKFRIK
jgi:Fe-S-cluster containining protein